MSYVTEIPWEEIPVKKELDNSPAIIDNGDHGGHPRPKGGNHLSFPEEEFFVQDNPRMSTERRSGALGCTIRGEMVDGSWPTGVPAY
jgi:hypothetical protein